MVKKTVLFSAVQNHSVIVKLVKKLKILKEFNLKIHDPTKDYFCLSKIPNIVKNADCIIVKVRNECSIDLLHFAKLYEIPTLHDVDSVLLCKNKIALDYSFRKIFEIHKNELLSFKLPHSWNQTISDIKKFKDWVQKKIPVVIKSHYQHDKYNRFNFLIQSVKDVDKFCEKYKEFLYYDVYIQKFIESDGIERKIYVIGDKVFGIKRENPIYKYLRENQEDINVELLEREDFKISEDIRKLSEILSKELNLKIFGFDLVKSIDKEFLYLIDLNDFPSFKGIKNVENDLADYIKNYISAI
ncbi:MAG: RimK family alpha-L-glutamate ligase [Candidatus Thorarchaeota archaeon]